MIWGLICTVLEAVTNEPCYNIVFVGGVGGSSRQYLQESDSYFPGKFWALTK